MNSLEAVSKSDLEVLCRELTTGEIAQRLKKTISEITWFLRNRGMQSSFLQVSKWQSDKSEIEYITSDFSKAQIRHCILTNDKGEVAVFRKQPIYRKLN